MVVLVVVVIVVVVIVVVAAPAGNEHQGNEVIEVTNEPLEWPKE